MVGLCSGYGALSILYDAADVQGDDVAATCHDTGQTGSRVEGILGELVLQAAAGCQGVGTVADVGEEGVSFGIHLCSEVLVLLVDDVTGLWVVNHSHGLYREGEDLFQAELVEPLHEHALQGVDGLPLWLCAVGVEEVAEQGVEVGVVIVGHVGERRLVGAVSCRLVDAPYELLEGLDDVVAYGTLLEAYVGSCHIVHMLVPFFSELADDVVVQHDEIFTEGYGSLTLGGEQEGEVGNLSAERLEVVWWARGYTVDVSYAVGHQWVEAHCHAVLLEHWGGCLVVCIDDVVVQVQLILACHFWVEGVQLVFHALALDDTVGGLVHLAFQVCHVLHGDIGIGIGL